MKKISSIILMSLAVLLFLSCGTTKKADKATQTWRYEIEYIKTGANNMQLVKVWSYSKSQKIAVRQAAKNAVHGVVFKGYAGGASTTSQRALVTNTNAGNDEFFNAFFANGGQYMKYVSSIANESMETKRVAREYKVGVVVSVNKDQLRKDLEAAGVIRGLTTGF